MVRDSNFNNGGWAWPPVGAPLNVQGQRDEQRWSSNFDSSVNAVSFGFVATAILISMFLFMAIFERFLRPSSPPSRHRSRRDLQSQMAIAGKLGRSSPKMSLYGGWVSVMNPGDEIPTFIAHPAPVPVPCCPERISWPSHHHSTLSLTCSTSSTLPSINQV